MQNTESGRTTFDDLFHKKEVLNFPEGKVTVVDINPDKDAKNNTILVAPGWSENYDTYKKTLSVIFNSNNRGICVSYSDFGPEALRTERTEDYPESELRKAKLLINMLDAKGIEKVDVIAHSEGAMNTIIAAMLRPDLFRNIVLDKPAGLIGEDTKVALIGRFVKLMLQESIARPTLLSDPTSSIQAATRTAKYIAENPKTILKEMDALTSFDLTELIKELKKQDIMASVIAGVDDPLFPISRQIKHLRENNGSNFDGYYSVIGGHNELSIRRKHSELALDALKSLQYRRENKIEIVD